MKRSIAGRKKAPRSRTGSQGVARTSVRNVSFPTTPALLMLIFLQNCSLGMQKQDGYEQVKGLVKRYLQETIISDEAAQDEEALWKKLLPNLLVTFYIYTDEFG